MKNWIIIICVIIGLNGCKDDEPIMDAPETPSYAMQILGKWSFEDVTNTTYLDSSEEVLSIDTFPVSDEAYLEFRNDLQIIGLLDGELDTATYSINENEKQVNIAGDVFMIDNITDCRLNLINRNRVKIPYTDYVVKLRR